MQTLTAFLMIGKNSMVSQQVLMTATRTTTNDGMSALDEYIAGTLPNDANSRLEITIKMLGGIAEISYNTVIGRNYELLVSENLETFVSWSTAAGNNAQHTLTFDPESASAGVNFGSNPEKNVFSKSA
jgi:hypothetical protein